MWHILSFIGIQREGMLGEAFLKVRFELDLNGEWELGGKEERE